MSKVLCQTSHVCCRYDVWCLLSGVWCLMSNVWDMYEVWCVSYYSLCMMSDVSHAMYDVLCVMSDVLCEMSEVRSQTLCQMQGGRGGVEENRLPPPPYLLALRHWERLARRNVCDSATEIPYWWRKICPECGQKHWLVDGVVTLV